MIEELRTEQVALQQRLERQAALGEALLDRCEPDPTLEPAVAARRRHEALDLFEHSPLPLAWFDRDGTALRVASAAWREEYGTSGEAPPAMFVAVTDVGETGDPEFVAQLALAVAGPPAYRAVVLRATRDRRGTISGVIVVTADITDEVVARELDARPDDAICGGPTGGLADYMNARWRAYAGTAGVRTSVHDEDVPRSSSAYAEAMRDRASTSFEARLRSTSGAYRWHRVRFVMASGGQRCFAVATDVHDARHARSGRSDLVARERAARADAEQASRLKDRFIAAAAHELRAPVTTMLLWEKVLRDPTSDDALRAQALDAIHQSAQAQSRLVGDLLDVSRAISGKLFVDLRPIELEQIVVETVDSFAPAAAQKRITLERCGRALGEVAGDAARLRQILGNLLSNAVKFTEPGGTILVTASHTNDAVEIAVVDTGRGIAPELLPHVFEPYVQMEDALTRSQGGLGLGLAIAKELAELHHGALTCTSEGPGRGATFRLRLPATFDRRYASSPPVGAHSARVLEGIRILLVDDDPRVREALAVLLERAGARVETAPSAEVARDCIAHAPPDALICDIAMPVEDGYSFIRRLRASGSQIPAIAVTGHATEQDAERARAAGFDRHLAKPVDVEGLAARIDELVSAARERAQRSIT